MTIDRQTWAIRTLLQDNELTIKTVTLVSKAAFDLAKLKPVSV